MTTLSEPVNLPNQQFDVAISFLSKDEPVARAFHDALSRNLNVFFFPRNQEEIAGTNGMETMRLIFREQSRINVVLFREGWGQTPWTRVEETAITEACLKRGWNRLFFVVLDDGKTLPTWLPETHIRFNFQDYGIDQAVGAIKLRVQEQGGVFLPFDADAQARLVQQEGQYLADKALLFKDSRWIMEDVFPRVAEILDNAKAKANKIAKDHGLLLMASSNKRQCFIVSDSVSVVVNWSQEFINKLETASFIVAEFNGRLALPDETRWYLQQPEELHRYRFLAELSRARELCWKEEKSPSNIYSDDQLADYFVRLFLSLFDRYQKGGLPSAVDRFLQQSR